MTKKSAGSGEQFLPSGDERGAVFTHKGRVEKAHNPDQLSITCLSVSVSLMLSSQKTFYRFRLVLRGAEMAHTRQIHDELFSSTASLRGAVN